MKHILTVLLCLLLWGCSPRQQTVSAEPAPQAPSEPAATGMYDPSHPMEARYPGQVRAYPLTQKKVHGLLSFGEDVLILSGQGNTTLTLLTGKDLQVAAVRTVGFELTQNDPSLQVHDGCISFFDPRLQETVLLDHRLQEVRTIAAPREITGRPILSADTQTLCYCTPWAVVAWDLETGIRRTVKELQYSSQELTALHWEDRILECTVTDGDCTQILLLSAENGAERHVLPEGTILETKDSGYFLSLYDGFQNLILFSEDSTEAELLLPEDPADAVHYLKSRQAAVTVRDTVSGTSLDYYELETGLHSGSLTLDQPQSPRNIVCCDDHAVYILVCDPAADCDILYRWDIPAGNAAGTEICTFPYYGKDTPDEEALAQCRQYADSIGRKYGISVKVWTDASSLQPWDYHFVPEYLAPVLQKELTLLDQRLSRYPEEILQQTVSRFDGLTLCLVRSITGNDGPGSLHTATGIQFFEDKNAFVAIATGRHSEQALYHEIYHVMETQILTKSSVLDQWESLNPADFSYGAAVPEAYLQGQTRAFADSYSTVSPKEDRARILENAMLPEKGNLFRSEYMQRKLATLCLGIREAYGLKKLEQELPWEQYLATPLVPHP